MRTSEGPLLSLLGVAQDHAAVRAGLLARLANGPLLVALRRDAGAEAIDFALAGIRRKLSLEPAGAAEAPSRSAAVAAVCGIIDAPYLPRIGSMATWFALLNKLVGGESGQPGDEATRLRLLKRAVDRGAAALALTVLEAARLAGPERADGRVETAGFELLYNLVKGDQRCWREIVFESAPTGSALRARRPPWAAAAASASGPGERAAPRLLKSSAPPWIVSVAVGVLKRQAARQPLIDCAWLWSSEAIAAVAMLFVLGFGTWRYHPRRLSPPRAAPASSFCDNKL